MIDYRYHHTAISVANVERSTEFYGVFGFETVLEWKATDGSLVLAHLRRPSGEFLEIIRYAENADTSTDFGVGNDLNIVGVKHMAFHVENLAKARAALQHLGEMTDVQQGRTGFELFFIKDPDGIWVEILSDERVLDASNPTIIEGAPRLILGE